MNNQTEETGLAALIQRGGVFYDIPGTTPVEVLTNLLELVPAPASVSREELLRAVLEREALMPTAIGHGIALPHPRNPLISKSDEQRVVIAFLKNPVDWSALDGVPVHTVLLAVSASAKEHLRTLSGVSFFCQQKSFRDLLQSRSTGERIIEVIHEAERAWKSAAPS